MMPNVSGCLFFVVSVLFFTVSLFADTWNDPYPVREDNEKIYYATFSTSPKTLDPALAYNIDESLFMGQIYEPLLQYDYEGGTYQLKPLTAKALPEVHYFDATGHEVSQNSEKIVKTIYRIRLKPHIFYAPHPAFSNASLESLGRLSSQRLLRMTCSVLPMIKKRQLISDDYIYQIKRLANPYLASPLYELFSGHIDGFREFSEALPKPIPGVWMDLRKYPLRGVRKIDDETFEIELKGVYTPFLYWLAMSFFAPIPWEVDAFYENKNLRAHNLGWATWPVGTGPFMLAEFEPVRRVILQKNPWFRQRICDGSRSEAMQYCHNRRLPLISKAVYTFEKESIPKWLKFLQGYYDVSQVSADSFFQAVQVTPQGTLLPSPGLSGKHVKLMSITDSALYYFGFNMLDPVVGGHSERARKLRLAISIAINYEENIALFLNGRGEVAQGPIPKGIFGYRAGPSGINPYVYTIKDKKPVRRSLDEAKRLLKEAGYPNGKDLKTGQPLLLHYDVSVSGTPDDTALLDWMRKQFRALGIALDIRATNYNRFQEKMRTGNAQMFSWAWVADYPDPENFLFLFYGKNGRVAYGGENTANYHNTKFDELFLKMRNRQNDTTRLSLIDQMIAILRHDAPWIFGKFTQSIALRQEWVSFIRPDMIFLNKLQYVDVDPHLRKCRQMEWNQPVFWPLLIFLVIFLIIIALLLWLFYKKEQHRPRRGQS